MCGLNGALYYGAAPDEAALRAIITSCGDRGQDSCGVVSWSENGWHDVKVLGGPSNLPYGFLPSDARIVINTNRAEPTTEWVHEKSGEDIQPFRTRTIAVSHNGILANDVELRREFAIETASIIDTAVLPPLMDRLGVRESIPKLVGGLALAILDARNAALHLYRNFMPLVLAWAPGVYYFSSEEKNLPAGGIGSRFVIETLPPFSGVTIESSGHLLRWA